MFFRTLPGRTASLIVPLDQAVLKGMKTDHYQPSPGRNNLIAVAKPVAR